MLLARSPRALSTTIMVGLYSAPPPDRTFQDDKPTLLVCWWCTSFAMTIILFRVAGRYVRSEKLFREDWLALWCLIPLLVRMALVHVVLLFGTNNSMEPAHGWSAEELYRRRTGSQMVLASRVFYAATYVISYLSWFAVCPCHMRERCLLRRMRIPEKCPLTPSPRLWMLKLTITEFFKRLTLQIWKRSYEVTLIAIRWFLLFTFICTVIADLSECQPFTHYWQVEPDPGGHCRQGFAQLLTMGICNVFTDLLLVFFPIPIILLSQMGPKRKIQLVLLFGLSIVPVVLSLYRMPAIINRRGQQQYRSVWASIEILAATGVANALVLGSFVRDRGVKKVKWKYGSASDSVPRSASRRGTGTAIWGSDEDLVRDIGLGLDPQLRSSDRTTPRIAPMATAANVPIMKSPSHHIDQNWQFPAKDIDIGEARDFQLTSDSCQPPSTPSRQVSFFDVSNLLGDASDQQPPRHTPSITSDGASVRYPPSELSSSSLSPTNTRRSSHLRLQDLGGLLKAGPRDPRGGQRIERSPSGWGIELQSIPQHDELEHSHSTPSLQDVGGLLK